MFSREELLRRIRRIEIKASRAVSEAMGGSYRSAFRGRGLEFDSVRKYVDGDDIRSIDWNVTARTGDLHVKEYLEERELNAILLLDYSMSLAFSSRHPTRLETVVQAASVIAFSAVFNSDKVSMLAQAPFQRHYLPPKKGRLHALRLSAKALETASAVEDMLSFPETGVTRKQEYDTKDGLNFLDRTTHRRSMIFVFSDFSKPGFEPVMKRMSMRHEIIPILVLDPWERELPDLGLVRFGAPGFKAGALIDTSDKTTRQEYSEKSLARIEGLCDFFTSLGLRHAVLWTDSDYISTLAGVIGKRQWAA
ncbi:MAG: DUF58 domain-containing protein [Deltaproteobacteria bacterium]|nr:DUF58 domain-containing protein [Deltaproteobacteria bacterium]